MKIQLLASLCLSFAVPVVSAREFTDPQGRKLEADIMSVSGANVTMKRTDGRMFTVPATTFTAADQKFIQQWAAENVTYAFDVTYNKKKIDSKTQRSTGLVETIERWAYEVALRNKQPVELQNLRVDYWLFKKEDSGKGKGSARVATSGSHKMEAVKGSASYQFETLPIELYKSKLEGNFIYIDGTRPRSADVMGGLVVRVFAPNGREVYCYASDEDLKAAAVGKTRGGGSNSQSTTSSSK